MKNELTAKQEMIYQFIQSYVEENQNSPSLREIGGHFDLSVGTVQDQVNALRKKGFLKKENTRARGLRLPWTPGQIPVLGRIHAGPLHQALENVEAHVPAAPGMSAQHHFALRVRGDSMIDAGILEGDIAIIRVQNTADDGDIVVARVEDESTLKTFRRRGGNPFLEPANANYQPIKDIPFEIVGVLVELRRFY